MVRDTGANSSLAALFNRRSRRLLGLAGYVARPGRTDQVLTRPLLADLITQASLVEELLDSCGARQNRLWYPLRSAVSAVRQFANVHYELLHIRYALPFYGLRGVTQPFEPATDQALAFCGQTLRQACARLLAVAQERGMPIPRVSIAASAYAEEVAAARLPHDRKSRSAKSVDETVSRLATAFLTLAAESDLVHAPAAAQSQDYARYIPDPISEESLRQLEDRFHSLQSLYDTYVQETETEELDTQLPTLRGHISVVMHLLRTATWLCHFYQRHLQNIASDQQGHLDDVLPCQSLLDVLMNYSIAFASRFIVAAKGLCQEMLKRYSKVGSIRVGVPRYRGFHIRPATLVAKIVQHYGSHVQMELDEECYDAGSPIDIFRANEKINAAKRWWLSREVSALPLVQEAQEDCDLASLVRRVIMTLAEKGVLIIYRQPLELPPQPSADSGTVLQRITQELGKLQATGKIDIAADLWARFSGDQRVLRDIALLAEAGYGEDNFGHNVELPQELTYLRREQ